MSILNKFRALFTLSEIDYSSRSTQINNQINPASGLPMTGAVDVAGNLFGSNLHDANRSSVSNGCNSLNSPYHNTMHQSYNYNTFNNPFNNY